VPTPQRGHAEDDERSQKQGLLLMSFDIFFTQDRTGGVRPGAPNPLHRIEIGPGGSLR